MLATILALLPTLALAQAAGDRSDAGIDADDARTDALLGTLNLVTPEPYGNLYSTAPGAEQQAARPQFRFNFLAPLNFDSNAQEISSGGTQTFGTFPVGNLSWAAPVADLPFRVSVNARSEFKRFFDASDVDIDRLTFSGRLQYVDPTNDQAFSPYFAVTPRFSYLPAFSDQTEARQDFNFGFNKSFHFDGSFHLAPIAADTSAETVWSFGLTVFAQRRLRQPQLSSDALVLIPSVSWVISKDWNASFAVELLGRWYETRFGGGSKTRPGSAADRHARIRHPGLPVRQRKFRQPAWPARDRFAGLSSEHLVDRARRQFWPVGGERDAEGGLAVLISVRSAEGDTASSGDEKLSLISLIALVVGSMVGSGIFALPAAFGRGPAIG